MDNATDAQENQHTNAAVLAAGAVGMDYIRQIEFVHEDELAGTLERIKFYIQRCKQECDAFLQDKTEPAQFEALCRESRSCTATIHNYYRDNPGEPQPTGLIRQFIDCIRSALNSDQYKRLIQDIKTGENAVFVLEATKAYYRSMSYRLDLLESILDHERSCDGVLCEEVFDWFGKVLEDADADIGYVVNSDFDLPGPDVYLPLLRELNSTWFMICSAYKKLVFRLLFAFVEIIHEKGNCQHNMTQETVRDQSKIAKNLINLLGNDLIVLKTSKPRLNTYQGELVDALVSNYREISNKVVARYREIEQQLKEHPDKLPPASEFTRNGNVGEVLYNVLIDASTRWNRLVERFTAIGNVSSLVHGEKAARAIELPLVDVEPEPRGKVVPIGSVQQIEQLAPNFRTGALHLAYLPCGSLDTATPEGQDAIISLAAAIRSTIEEEISVGESVVIGPLRSPQDDRFSELLISQRFQTTTLDFQQFADEYNAL